MHHDLREKADPANKIVAILIFTIAERLNDLNGCITYEENLSGKRP